MLKAIREAGRLPVQRNTFYEPLKSHAAPGQTPAHTSDSGSKLLESNLATA
jgi:hypothetical protein